MQNLALTRSRVNAAVRAEADGSTLLMPAPATPRPWVVRIDGMLRKALLDPALQARIEPHGNELIGSTPEDVLAWVRRDADKWGRIVRSAGIALD